MPTPDGSFIFVSYSSKDAHLVHLEIERLESNGYAIWFDQGELEPARFWAEDIREAIGACACFVVFITEDSVASANVCDEISQALKANKPIVGIYWDEVTLPSELQSQIRLRQTLDRHSMHASNYEDLLNTALSKYLAVAESRMDETATKGLLPSPPRRSSEVLPTIVVFGLLMLLLILFVLALVSFVMPYLPSTRPSDDLFNNRLVSLLAGLVFLSLGLACGAAAFAVFRTYLRSGK